MMGIRRSVAFATLLILFLTPACATGKRTTRCHYDKKGIASWYGDAYQGRQTACGEPFDMNKMTAAHKKLPFGALVEVKRRDTGRKTTVRINDRGPFIRGRIIDLSKAAARDLNMVQDGVAPVKIKVVRWPK